MNLKCDDCFQTLLSIFNLRHYTKAVVTKLGLTNVKVIQGGIDAYIEAGEGRLTV